MRVYKHDTDFELTHSCPSVGVSYDARWYLHIPSACSIHRVRSIWLHTHACIRCKCKDTKKGWIRKILVRTSVCAYLFSRRGIILLQYQNIHYLVLSRSEWNRNTDPNNPKFETRESLRNIYPSRPLDFWQIGSRFHPEFLSALAQPHPFPPRTIQILPLLVRLVAWAGMKET